MQLVGGGHTGLHEVLAGADVVTQRDRRWRIRLKGPPAMPVGAQAVSEHVGVGPIRLVARCPVAFAQRLHRPAGNDDDVQPGAEQSIDHRTVGAFDRHPASARRRHSAAQLGETGAGVVNLELDHDQPLSVDHAHGVGVSRPVDTSERFSAIMHISLLAVAAVGKHPVVAGRVCRSLTDRRSGRVALLPVGTSWATGSRRTRPGSRTASAAGDDPMGPGVHHQQQHGCRHRHSAPVSAAAKRRRRARAVRRAAWLRAEPGIGLPRIGQVGERRCEAAVASSGGEVSSLAANRTWHRTPAIGQVGERRCEAAVASSGGEVSSLAANRT